MEKLRIYPSGGILPFYVVQDRKTGKTLFSGPKLRVRFWCLTHGYGWPTAADLNG